MIRRLRNRGIAVGLLCTLACIAPAQMRSFRSRDSSPDLNYLSPSALALSPSGEKVYIACSTGKEVAVLDTLRRQIIRRFPISPTPSGIAIPPDGKQVYVTCAAPESQVIVLDSTSGKTIQTIPGHHTTLAPVVSANGRTLYTCNRFNDDVSVIDIALAKEVRRIPVDREPVAAALTPDGRYLLVANHLPSGRAGLPPVAGKVTIIDTAKSAVARQISLPDGTTLLRGICVSPDGRLACVTHTLGRYNLPTTQSEHGWINNNALSILDLTTWSRLATVLLDEADSGAANPWAVAWSADDKFICVTHTGSQELTIIDAQAFRAKLQSIPPGTDPSNDLAFMNGLRTRVKVRGNGPRSLVLAGHKAYVANYFSDSLSEFDLDNPEAAPFTLTMDTPAEISRIRLGELLFNDASISFQSWHSCASCHSSDARTDALNWDLVNDGIGNAKNARSLLHSFDTPPAMALGVRANAAAAIRAGIRGTMFATVPEDYSSALDAYVLSLRPVPSPHLVNGNLSRAAERGKQTFFSEAVGCAECHNGPLFTNLKPYDVGTSGALDRAQDRFYTPTLIETWRTAPYLHDGSAATMRDVLTRCNGENRHGKTSHLSASQIEDLLAFLLSL